MFRLKQMIAGLVMVLGLVACGGGGSSESAETPTGGGGSTPTPTPDPVSPPPPLPISPAPNATNAIALTNVSGAALSNWPLQFGRLFKQGEITGVPGIFVNNAAVASQAEVTQRWADGSVRFAVMSVVVPSLGAGTRTTLTFGASTASTGTLTVDQLLTQFPEVDLQIVASQGSVQRSVTARDMLRAGSYQWLANGPLRYELLVADHVSRTHDFGFGEYKSLRPTFTMTFWPTLGKARVRAVVEAPNLDALKSETYDVDVKAGVTAPQSVLTQTSVRHDFGARWTRSFWFGGEPEARVNVEHGVAYLASTGIIPNYDPSNAVPPSAIDGLWSRWGAQPKGLFEPGLWFAYMPTTGMRDDIGPMPGFIERWLSSGDWRMREISLRSADLAGAWRLHFREHDPNLRFDREGQVPAPGRPISINAHPTLWFPNNNGIFEGAIGSSYNQTGGFNWTADGAHQPDPFGVPYLLSGDHHYLGSLQMWAATQALAYAPGAYGRGAAGYAGITDQVRGNGWVFRNRALAAALSSDGTPEKRYFYQLLDDALAYWVGQRGINDPRLADHPNRIWGAANYPADWSPLRFWYKDTSSRQSAFWQESFFVMQLGIARDLGVKVDPLLAEYQKVITGLPNSPGLDARMLAIYYSYTQDTAPTYTNYQTWAEFAAKNLAEQPAAVDAAIQSFEMKSDPFYPVAVTAAASTLTSYDGGLVSWYWLKGKVHDKLDMTGEYRRWKLLPRAETPPAPPVP